MACIALAVFASACADQPPAKARSVPERFVYESRTYELDAYEDLFDTTKSLGLGRNNLFSAYLANSKEGKQRRTAAGSDEPKVVWSKMAAEEKSTFVAVTNALHCVTVNGQGRMLDWIKRLDEIHGGSRFGGGSLKDSEAFRLWGGLTDAALKLLNEDSGSFKNECNGETYTTGGVGSTHDDFCTIGKHFDGSAKYEHYPDGTKLRGIQFNFNVRRSDCTDVDIDYSNNVVCHNTVGNSNVLDDCLEVFRRVNHIDRLTSEYGSSSGLRLVTNP